MGEESRIGEDLGAAFEGVAERMALYTSYDEVFSEISRRIDSVLPEGGESRKDLIESVFKPLSAQILRSLRTEGLDLSRAEAAKKALSVGRESASDLDLSGDRPGIQGSRRPPGRYVPRPHRALSRDEGNEQSQY